MAVSDRIAVMDHGIIQHIGSPQNIYHRPANVFVASFIGRTNILEKEIKLDDKGNAWLDMSDEYKIQIDNLIENKESKFKVSIRPEDFIIKREGCGLRGIVKDNMFLGTNTHYLVDLENGETVEIIQESSIDKLLDRNSQVVLNIKKDKINIFDFTTEENILQGVVNDVKNKI